MFRRNAEAVVYVCERLTVCKATRLLALLKSAGVARDVWLLHNNPEGDKHSQGLVLDLIWMGLRVAKQQSVPSTSGWDAFTGNSISRSKGAFLMWMNGADLLQTMFQAVTHSCRPHIFHT